MSNVSTQLAPTSTSSPLAWAERGAPGSRRSSSTEDEPAISEPPDLRGLPQVVASVQARHPLASPALVQRCVDDAVQGLRDARVRHYLLILVERWASDAVRDALTLPEEALRVACGSTEPAPATELKPRDITLTFPSMRIPTRAGGQRDTCVVIKDVDREKGRAASCEGGAP